MQLRISPDLEKIAMARFTFDQAEEGKRYAHGININSLYTLSQ